MESAPKHMFYYSLSKIDNRINSNSIKLEYQKKFKRHKNRTIDNKGSDWWNKSLNHDLHWALRYFTWFWFWEISLLLPNCYLSLACLILKSSLLLLIHSRPFLLLRHPYFIPTVSLVHFLSLFSWVSRWQISTWVTCYLSFIIINFRRIQHAMRLVEKACFMRRV